MGCIDLESPFEKSWLWKTDNDTIWVSSLFLPLHERGKGHVSRLIDGLMKQYSTIIVPIPNKIMTEMLARRGFQYFKDSNGKYMILQQAPTSQKTSFCDGKQGESN